MDKKDREIKVNTGGFAGTKYAHITSITVTDIDVTIDFIYVHPNENIKEGQIVSRVTLPRQSAVNMVDAITDTLKKHEKQNKS